MQVDIQALNEEFESGNVEHLPDGFYRGELTMLLPVYTVERIGDFVSKFWLPWRGKYFIRAEQRGDNILKHSAKLILSLRKSGYVVGKTEFGGFHAFPFTTSIEKGLASANQVMRISYDLPENPPFIRTVIDEIVCVQEKAFLGKAFLVESGTPRLVAYYRLTQ